MLATLLELGVPHEDVDEIISTTIPPSLQSGFDAHVAQLTSGEGGALPQFVQPEGAPRFYFVLVYLAALPFVKQLHADRGIPRSQSRLILADLGRQLAVHRRRYGTPGLDTADWLTRHFQGRIFQLGRLQFEQVTLGQTTGTSIRNAGLPYGPNDHALSIHIPEYSGPFTPAAVSASIASAQPFFARHFPEIRYEIAICHSWLLDPELVTVLPESSNILAFQRLFTFSHAAPSDSILRFVVPGSRLHETVAKLSSNGHEWKTGSGWILFHSS